MKLEKKNVTIQGDWEDEVFTGLLESGPELDGFWVNTAFKAYSNDGYIIEIELKKWESGYIDEDNNECLTSESLDDLFEKKVRTYIKNAIL